METLPSATLQPIDSSDVIERILKINSPDLPTVFRIGKEILDDPHEWWVTKLLVGVPATAFALAQGADDLSNRIHNQPRRWILTELDESGSREAFLTDFASPFAARSVRSRGASLKKKLTPKRCREKPVT